MKKTIKIVSALLLYIAILLFARWRMNVISEVAFECRKLGERADFWETTVKYSMLSEDIQNLISEEEFNDYTDEGRLKMYRKIENVWFVKKDANKFLGSTRHGKTPPCDLIELDGEIYFIEFYIDVDFNPWALKPEPKVVNFSCTIHEINSEVTE